MLKEQSSELDRIFGSSNYSIMETSEYCAILETQLAQFQFSDDPRDFVSVEIISVPGLEVQQSPIDTWVQFLGEDPPAQERSDPYEEQMSKELHWVAVIVDRILRDKATARDAAWFVSGYNRAYNDWASKKGSWTESEDFN